MRVVALVLAVGFAAMGVRSAMKWLRVDLPVRTAWERVLFVVNVTARIGLWFAFAGFFVGYALVEEPQGFRWYVMVPLGSAAVQLLTALALDRATKRSVGDEDGEPDRRRRSGL